MAATAMTADLFNLFVCLEVMGIASYILVASSEKPGAFLASFSYLMISATAMVFFLLGLLGFYRLTGSLSYEGIAEVLNRLPDKGGLEAAASLALIAAAVAIRVAIMPLYGWLPDAHAPGAPCHIRRFVGSADQSPSLCPVPDPDPDAGRTGHRQAYELHRSPGGSGGGRHRPLPERFQTAPWAYHSISQIGYIVAAWGAAVWKGLTTEAGLVLFAAAFLHALYHALFKGLLFLTVGTTTDTVGERDVYKIRGALRELKKAGEKVPLTFLCFLTGALAITAIPPFNGFASKSALSYAFKRDLAGFSSVCSLCGNGGVFYQTFPDLLFPERGRIRRCPSHGKKGKDSDFRIPPAVPGSAGSSVYSRRRCRPGHFPGDYEDTGKGYGKNRPSLSFYNGELFENSRSDGCGSRALPADYNSSGKSPDPYDP